MIAETHPLFVLVVLAAALHAQEPRLGIEVVTATAPAEDRSVYEIRDLDGDGTEELVLADEHGVLRVLRLTSADGSALEPVDEGLRLPDPARSVLALADVRGDGRLELVVLSSSGTVAYSLQESGGFGGEPVVLTASGRLGFRVGAPAFVEFVQDVNADGAADLVIPGRGQCELWLQSGTGEAQRFDLSQTLPIEFDHSLWTESYALSEEMRNRIRVPRLDIADLNGDGRPDLRVREGERRLFFLQGEDGRFADRAITLDISIFQDTTPEASVRLGETIVLSKHQIYQSGDLNGDGIPDHVIAHRRKVWSFLASADGPQFTKARTRMVAEDVSGMLLIHLDDDDRKDLLIFKVDVPSAGDLVLGLVSSIDVPITVLGYRTDEAGDFESRTTWRRELTLRAPSLLSLLGQADDLVQRFMEVLSKFRWSAIGDFDGDGADDLTLIGEDSVTTELWLRPKGAERLDRATERWLRELMFENPNTVFDIDRLFKLLAQVFDTRTSSLTGERAADARGTLPERRGRYIVDLRAADLDGDGRAELVLVDDDEQAPGQLAFIVLRWSDGR